MLCLGREWIVGCTAVFLLYCRLLIKGHSGQRFSTAVTDSIVEGSGVKLVACLSKAVVCQVTLRAVTVAGLKRYPQLLQHCWEATAVSCYDLLSYSHIS